MALRSVNQDFRAKGRGRLLNTMSSSPIHLTIVPYIVTWEGTILRFIIDIMLLTSKCINVVL